MKINCLHVDTCLNDYWSGHHLPHIAVPVYRRMRIGELRKALHNELNQGCVMGCDTDARLLHADMVRPHEEKRADQLTRAAHAAINRDVKMRKPGKSLPFWNELQDYDESDNDCYVYAYFVLDIED